MRNIQVRLRTAYQAGQSLGVLRDSDTIQGVVGMQTGEALGHRMVADTTTLAITRDLSNQAGGLSSRFGHPGMSENATGKKLAVARDFRLSDSNTLRFDMHMLQAARQSPVFGQDPVEYVLQVAETAPSELGMSYVLRTDLAWSLQDGTERPLTDEEARDHAFDDLDSPIDSVFEFPVMRPTSVHFVDIVNEGALTSDAGLLEVVQLFDGRSSEYLHEIFHTVDEWRSRYGIPLNEVESKIDGILEEYIHSRGGSMSRRSKKRQRTAQLEEVVPTLDAVVPPEEEELGGPQGASGHGAVEDLKKDGVVVGRVFSDNDDFSDLDELGEELQELKEDIVGTEDDLDNDQYSHLQEQVAYLSGSFETMSAKVDKLTSMMRDTIDALQTLSRNQSRLSGEPVVTEPVRTAPRQPLEQLEFAHPAPADARPVRRGKQPKNAAAYEAIRANNEKLRRLSVTSWE